MARDTVLPPPTTLACRFRPLSGGGRRAGSFKTVNDLRVGADVNGVRGGSRRTWYRSTVPPQGETVPSPSDCRSNGPSAWAGEPLRDSGGTRVRHIPWRTWEAQLPRRDSHNCPAATLRSPLVRLGHVPATTPVARVAKESTGFPEAEVTAPPLKVLPAISVTCGLRLPRRSTVMSPAFSSLRSARALASGWTPHSSGWKR